VNLVKRVVKEILDKGKVVRSSFGLRIQETRELEELIGSDLRRGVLVASVEPAGPAQRAGIRAGDLMLQIDGEDVVARFAEELPAIYNRIARFSVGSEHTIRIQRRGREMALKLTTEELTQIRGRESEASDWGLTIRDLTETQKRQLDVSKGVYVTGTRPGGPAARAKFAPGDVIQEVAGKTTTNVEAFKAAVAEAVANREKHKVVGVRLRRGKGRYIKAVRLAE
jgi:serine protease Do